MKNLFDVMDLTVQRGNMQWGDYQSVISKLGVSIQGTGISFNEASAALATMTNEGFSAQKAQTYLSNTFTTAVIKTDAMAAHAAKAGISFDQQGYSSMDLAHKIEYLNQITDGNKQKILALLGNNATALKTFNALSSGIGSYNENLKALDHSQGALAASFATASQGFSFQMDRLKALFESVKIGIGMVLLPILTKAAQFLMDTVVPAIQSVWKYLSSFDLTPIAYAWKQLTDAIQGILKPLGGASGAMKEMSPFLDDLRNGFSQLLVSGIKDIAGFITNIAHAIQSFTKSGAGADIFSGMSQAFKSFAPEIKNIANIIGGQLMRQLRDLGDLAQAVGKWFMSSVMPAIKDALPGFENLAHTLLDTVIPALLHMRDMTMDLIEHAVKTFGPIIERIIPPLMRFAGIIANDIANGLKFIMPYVTQVMQAFEKFGIEIQDRVAPILNQWIDGAKKAVHDFMTVWNAVWPYLAPIVKGVWTEIVGTAKIAWAILTGGIKIFLDILSGNWKQAWTDILDMFKGIWDGIKTYLQGTLQIIIGMFKPLLIALSNIPGPVGDMAKRVLGSFDSMDQGTKKSTTGVSVSVAVMKANVLARTAEMETEAAKHLDKMRQELIAQIQNTSDPVQKHSLEMRLGVVTNMEKMHTQSAQHAQAMANDVVKHAQVMSDQMVGHSVIPDMVNAVIQWFQQMGPRALSAVSTMANQVLGRLSSLASDAVNAGASIVNGVANGIRGAIGNVTGAIGSVVAEIDAHLPHSPAKKGPLSQLNLYGPALVNTFAKDIASTSPKARAAAEQMASGVAKAIKSYSYQIALAHVSGNKTQEAALRKEYSDLVAQYKLYSDLAKSHGFTMNSKDTNNPINFGGNTPNSGALSMVARFTADLKANTPKAQAAAEQMMLAIQKVLLTYPAAIAKAHLQGNKIQEAALSKQYTNMKDQFTLYKKLIDQNGFVYNAKSNTPIDFHPVLHLGGTSATSSSSSGGGYASGGLSITNNITINANNADPNKVYQLVLKQITRDLNRSGGLVTTSSGGRL
jgi:phage-related protein